MSEPTWELLGGGGVVGGPIDYVGDWAAGVTYQPGQVVRYAGVDYLAVNPSLGQVPPLASPLAPGMVCIFDQILAANAGSFDVPNIPQNYAHLLIKATLRGTDATGQITNWWRFNGDLGTNYFYEYLVNYATTVQYNEGLAQSQIFAGNAPAATAPAGAIAQLEAEIQNYAGTVFQKAIRGITVNRNGIVSSTVRKDSFSGHWLNTAAINRINLSPGAGFYLAGSRLSIYGLLAAGQPQPVTTLAPGGIGTAFPASPTNGELFTLVDSLTAPTYAWDFRYVASITDAYKWVFVGGSPKMSRLETDYPANPVLTMTVPNAGYYKLGNGASYYNANLDTIFSCYLAINGAGNYAYWNFRGVGSMPGYMSSGYGEQPNQLCPAGATIAQTFNPQTSARIERRWISVLPVRLS